MMPTNSGTPAPLDRQQSGQAMTEWIIVVGAMVIALAAIIGAFPEALGHFYQGIVSVLLLPIT